MGASVPPANAMVEVNKITPENEASCRRPLLSLLSFLHSFFLAHRDDIRCFGNSKAVAPGVATSRFLDGGLNCLQPCRRLARKQSSRAHAGVTLRLERLTRRRDI